MAIRELRPTFSKEFYFGVSRGEYPNFTYVNKFGRNPLVDSNISPISIGGIYRTPTSGTTLRVKAGGNANDTAAGSGAQQITLEGLDTNYALASDTVETAGASASSATSVSFIRLFRAYVSRSGTYATQSAGSHEGDIVIEDSSGTEDWATISATGFPRGQTQIGAYTIPAGHIGYLIDSHIAIEANKNVDVYGFRREAADDVDTPFSGIMRLFDEFDITAGPNDIDFETPIPLVGPCDVGYMSSISAGNAIVSVQFHLILENLNV